MKAIRVAGARRKFPITPVSDAAASLFLGRGTFGASAADITALRATTYRGWIEEQLSLPLTDTWAAYRARGRSVFHTVERGAWDQYARLAEFMVNYCVHAPDQVRWRMTLALSEIIVIGGGGVPGRFNARQLGPFVDVLYRNALGNFRTLLEEVTYCPVMADWLTYMNNERQDGTGRQPDENYAREILQLFSIGLWELNLDGSRKKAGELDPADPRYVLGGQDEVPTYDLTDIRELAKVFTGMGPWDEWFFYATFPEKYEQPLAYYPQYHETGPKVVLKSLTIPANTPGPQSLTMALDAIFAHPNVGPFICHQLIQKLVTSNPSPGYIARVASVFNNDGTGVRGNLAAVARAILLDQEALSPNNANSNVWGRIRSFYQMHAHRARALGLVYDEGDVGEDYGPWSYAPLPDATNALITRPMCSPSVFNFYRPDYTPQGALLEQGLVAPEMQVLNSASVALAMNFAADIDQFGITYGEIENAVMPLYPDREAMFDHLNTLIAAGQITSESKQIIMTGLNEIWVEPGNQGHIRTLAKQMVSVIFHSLDYMVQK